MKNKVYTGFWEKVGDFLAALLPFYLPILIERSIDKSSRSILDVGGGKGVPMKAVNRTRKFWTVNNDIFLPNLKEAKKRGSHNEYVLSDARTLPFKEGSFDVALGLDLLEHLPKDAGIKLLEDLERICCREIIVSVPCNAVAHPSLDPNPYEEHISRWTFTDFEKQGFEVRKWGPRRICGESFHYYLLSKPIFRPIAQTYALVTAFLSFFFPKIGGHVIAIKRKG